MLFRFVQLKPYVLLDPPTPFVSHVQLAYIQWVPILHHVPSFHAFGTIMFHRFLLFLSFFLHFLSPLAKIDHLIPSCKKKNLRQKNDFCNGCMKKKGSIMDLWKLVNYLCFPNDKLFLLVDIKIFKYWRLCWHIS
jgi:hypothetical protein